MITASAEAKWQGGPDLLVSFFIPPIIIYESNRIFHFNETTSNRGTSGSAGSTTRYYLSSSPPPFDVNQSVYIGERIVPPLLQNEDHESGDTIYTLPDNLQPAMYYLAACADARNEVIELNENNNCSFNSVSKTTVVVPLIVPENLPPVCGSAKPDTRILWPPNHKLIDVKIEGVTDPDGDQLLIKAIKVTQDEPVNGLGDGDTAPDATVISGNVQLRSERSGTGNGRVYAISFKATDTKGASCTGNVNVGVPHDQGRGVVPVDDGQVYDSTVPY